MAFPKPRGISGKGHNSELKKLSQRGYNTVGGRDQGGRNLKPGGVKDAGGAGLMPHDPGSTGGGPLPRPSSRMRKQ